MPPLVTSQYRGFLTTFPIPRVKTSGRSRSHCPLWVAVKECLQGSRYIASTLREKKVFDSSHEVAHWASTDAISVTLVPGHRNVSRKYSKNRNADTATKLLHNIIEEKKYTMSASGFDLFYYQVRCRCKPESRVNKS